MLRRLVLLAVVCATLGLGACGGDSDGATPGAGLTLGCANSVPWDKASASVGKRASVIGPVVSTKYAGTATGSPTFINVGKEGPASGTFTVVVWGGDRSKFPNPPEKLYAGKTICVTGLISTYRGQTEIEIKSPDAIVIQ